jgi:hypothetical protein
MIHPAQGRRTANSLHSLPEPREARAATERAGTSAKRTRGNHEMMQQTISTIGCIISARRGEVGFTKFQGTSKNFAVRLPLGASEDNPLRTQLI